MKSHPGSLRLLAHSSRISQQTPPTTATASARSREEMWREDARVQGLEAPIKHTQQVAAGHTGQGTCCQLWGPVFSLPKPHGGRREPTPENYPLLANTPVPTGPAPQSHRAAWPVCTHASDAEIWSPALLSPAHILALTF